MDRLGEGAYEIDFGRMTDEQVAEHREIYLAMLNARQNAKHRRDAADRRRRAQAASVLRWRSLRP